MSTYYEFKGSLSFPSAAIAKAAYVELTTSDAESVFHRPAGARPSKVLVCKGAEITFNDCNFAGAEPFYSARAALERVVRKAIAGRVRVQEGDGEGSSFDWYGFKPRKKVAKKTADKTKRKKLR